MNYKTLIAASLMSITLTSAAFAQCTDCAMYPDRDYLNKGVPTPASTMMVEPGGAAAASTANFDNGAYNGRAGARVAGAQRRHPHDAHASMAAAPADSPSHRVYVKNLHDSGYNPARDVDGAGNIKVN